ncbi:MAG: hypothetical protein KTR31_37770 [Myxococcales bacterium]|nr:hypothetical protein [Myxococcales bacterium]
MLFRATGVIVVAMAWVSGCDQPVEQTEPEEEVIEPGTEPEPTTEETTEPEPTEVGEPPVGEGLLGHGYDVFGDYANPLEVTLPVLDLEALDEAGLLVDFQLDVLDFDVIEGTSLESYSRAFSELATVGPVVGPFSGAVANNFEADTQGRMEFAYATLQLSSLKQKLQVQEARPEVLRGFLTDEAQQDIDLDGFPPDLLIEKYGSHVVIDAFVGGRVDFSMAADLSEVPFSVEVGTAIQGSFENQAGNLGLDLEIVSDEVREVFERGAVFKTIAHGGQSELIGNTLSNLRVDQWLDTVGDAPVLMAFSDDSALIPLWELASEQSRRDEIEAAFEEASRPLAEDLKDGPTRFEVTLSMLVPDGQAADQGGGNLEIYGDVEAAGLQDVTDGASVVDESVLFRRSGGSDFITIEEGELVEIDTATLTFDAFDEVASAVVLSSDLTERDPGTSSDDDFGRRGLELLFREPGATGSELQLLVGRHEVTHGTSNSAVKVFYDIALVD